jgi:hypothetical protein
MPGITFSLKEWPGHCGITNRLPSAVRVPLQHEAKDHR